MSMLFLLELPCLTLLKNKRLHDSPYVCKKKLVTFSLSDQLDM